MLLAAVAMATQSNQGLPWRLNQFAIATTMCNPPPHSSWNPIAKMEK